MIDPATSYRAKLTRLASAGRQGLPIEQVGIGTAVHMAVTGMAEPIRVGSEHVVISRQGREAAQAAEDWSCR